MDKHQHSHDHHHDHDREGNCVPSHELAPLTEYEQHGVRFRYPTGWELSEQSGNDETSISVQSDGTSFWTVVLLNSRPDPDEVLDSVVETFEQDYEEVDVLTQVGSICGLPALGRGVDFVCYDLLNTAILRAFQTSDKTVFILYQGTDHELESTQSQLEAISASFQCDDDDASLE